MQGGSVRSLLRLECGQQRSSAGSRYGVGAALLGCAGSGDRVGYWMWLGLAHSRKHNKIIALQQSECGAAQGEAGKRTKNEAYVQKVVRFPRGGAGVGLL